MFTPKQDKLRETAIDLTHKYGWTQGVLARDAKGVVTSVEGPEAVSFCAVGFLKKAKQITGVSEKVYEKVLTSVQHKVLVLNQGSAGVAYSNDFIATSVEDVREWFKK